MANIKERVVTYRRALWPANDLSSQTLEALVKRATDKFQTVPERTIVRGNGQQIALFFLKKASSGGWLLHIAADTPGEEASVVPKARAAKSEIDVLTAPPPSGADYMDGDAFVYIVDDHVCFCTTGIQDRAIEYFLQTLIGKAIGYGTATHFDLAKVADVKRLTFLKSQGVKEIILSATVSEASAHYANRKTQTISIAGAVGRHLKAVLGKDNDVSEDALRVHVALLADKRRRGLRLGERRMKELAVDLIENEEAGDEYTIITQSGQRISPNEIFVKSHVRVAAKAKSVDRDAAWKELTKFHEHLKNSGILAE